MTAMAKARRGGSGDSRTRGVPASGAGGGEIVFDGVEQQDAVFRHDPGDHFHFQGESI